MTFLSTQTLDDNGKLKVVVDKRKILESGEVKDGKLTGKARVKYEYGELDESEIRPFSSIEEAESFIMDEGELFWAMSTPPLNHIDDSAKLAHRMANARANIMASVKRNGIVTILYHPSVQNRIDEAKVAMREMESVNPMDPEGDMIVTQVPYFEDDFTEFVPHDGMPDDTVLVLFKGSADEDQGIIYVEGHGLALNDKVTDPENYGKFVRIP